MSYEIIYGNIGIDLKNGKRMVMLLSGSNNSYEYSFNGRMKRSRSWFDISANKDGKCFGMTESHLIEKYNSDSEDYSNIVKNSKPLSDKQFSRLVRKTFNNAKTIEYISDNSMGMLRGHVRSKESDNVLFSDYIKTTKELNDFIDKYDSGKVREENYVSIYFINDKQIVVK